MRVKTVAAGILAAALTSVVTVTTASTPATANASSTATAAKSRDHLTPGWYNVASFNILGASHTKGGARGMAPASTRMGWTKLLLEKHRVHLAGFQEMQPSQVTQFLDVMDGEWAVYPGNTGKALDADNSIGWRVDKFRLVQATTVSIPYFNGSPRRMPLVLLRDKKSGMLTYFSNFHNPATNKKRGNQDKWRRAAENVEAALQNQIVDNGIPRIMTGDFNERSWVFCRLTGLAPLKAARPESYRKNGKCHANKPRSVDWIFGSLRVEFSNYKEDRDPLVKKTTDHPIIVSKVVVRPEQLPNGWQVNPPAPIVPEVSWAKRG